MRTGFQALLLLAGVAACAADGDTGTPAAVRDTLPSGAERVRYGPLPLEPPSPVQPELRIGTLDGDSHFIFGDVRGIEVGSDGTIYVLDHQAADVRAFGPDGSFEGYVAHRGQGPGEIMQPNGIARAPDGTLWVQDAGQWQLLRLESTGEEVERMPMFVRQVSYYWDGVVDGEGRIWTAWFRSLGAADPGAIEPGLTEGASEESVVVHDPRTGGEDTIYVARSVSRGYVMLLEGGAGFRAMSVPFQARHLMALDPAGAVWSATGDAYRIVRLDAAGDTTLVVEVDRPGAPVSSEDRETFTATAREQGPDYERAAREISRVMPAHKPVLSQLVVDDEGRLWVRRFAEDDAEPAHFDVFDRDGHYLGSIRLGFRTPPGFPARIRDERLYTVAVDEYDVPSVVRVAVEFAGS